MATITRGSIWRKWDLHVHTPDSFYHNYPGTEDQAWESFLSDLEALPEDFKVLGINDYVLVDGYEKVLQAKQKHGRLKNIDLILPVIELRLDKFGGTVKAGEKNSNWSRINLHIIFDQVDPQFLREQFITAISPQYRLTPGSSGSWRKVITRSSIEDLGKSILDSVPQEKIKDYSNALIEGFNNLCVSAEGVLKALENDALKNKFVLAVGKTEWENLKWNDHTVAEKKTLINSADLVFTAANSPNDYKKAKEKLREERVNHKLLDCSDAHWLSSSTDKDRIGNCFTWIKADCSFAGLLQAIQEFDDRIFVGDIPPKKSLVNANRTKFIKEVTVRKKQDSTLPETWFDLKLPLNADLTAVIGNKGSGKSALADIIALAGCARNTENFSFLTPHRFRGSRGRLASQFVASLEWHDGTLSEADLDKNPPDGSVERVKYLPQRYLEDLCNELGDGGSRTFDAELRKIIYSHVPEEDRLGQPSMDQLLAYKVSEINKARQALKQDISDINAEIIELEHRNSPEFKISLEKQLESKMSELASLETSKPQEVEDPNASQEALEDAKKVAARIDTLEMTLKRIEGEVEKKRQEKSGAILKLAVAKKVQQALASFSKQNESFKSDLLTLLDELNLAISVDSIFKVEIDSSPIDKMADKIQKSIIAIEEEINSKEPGSFSERKAFAAKEIEEAKNKLDEKQRQYVRYKEQLTQWRQGIEDIKGSADKPQTVAWLQSEIASLSHLPEQLRDLKIERDELVTDIHKQIMATLEEYKRLYGPVQEFVASAQQMDMELPLKFHVRVEVSGFEEQFLAKLNRQVRGSFSGVEESAHRVRDALAEIDFDQAAQTVFFANKIDDMLHFDRRDEQVERDTRVSDQLRRGIEPLEVLNYIFSLDYLSPRYSLTYAGQEIGQLSPGERGLLLLVFYLLVDKSDIPIVTDQPEENLDNQTIYRILVKCIKQAKEHRQVIMVTHNPNLAVVCDAEQIVYASCDKVGSRFDYEAGAIEQPEIKSRVVQILEGTEPAFKNRQSKYRLL